MSSQLSIPTFLTYILLFLFLKQCPTNSSFPVFQMLLVLQWHKIEDLKLRPSCEKEYVGFVLGNLGDLTQHYFFISFIFKFHNLGLLYVLLVLYCGYAHFLSHSLFHRHLVWFNFLVIANRVVMNKDVLV